MVCDNAGTSRLCAARLEKAQFLAQPTGTPTANINQSRGSAMAYQALEINREGEIAWLTLNRPQALNALNAVIVDELHDYLRASS
jgi:hypothetical protein